MPSISALLVTMRPAFLPAIRAMLDRQTYPDSELIIGLHKHRVRDLQPDERRALDAAQAVLELPPAWSLGRCLNAALAEAHGDFVAKIDDDDLYGRAYLAEAVKHLSAADGDIVGKTETYLYDERSGAVLLRWPGKSLRITRHVQGPTLAFRRSVARAHPFRDVTLGEDRLFLEDCRTSGKTVYATSRRQFMYVRRAAASSHTSPCAAIESEILLRRMPSASPPRLLALIE